MEQEEIGGFAASANPWNLHRFATYVTTVADYTSHNLTFGSDILNGSVGIGNCFVSATGKRLLYGLPERHFAQALLWEHDGEYRQRQNVPDIPSWSWAFWNRRSKYDTNSSVEKRNCGTLHGSEDYIASTGLAHPGKLVFQTTSANVSLQKLASHSHVETPGFIKLDIVTNGKLMVGQLAQLPQAWTEKYIDLDIKHTIIVIAAGIASEPARYAQTHSTRHVLGHTQEPRKTESAWFLHVMLVSEICPVVAQRVGIGMVEMRAWSELAPEYDNIVLS
ncbi:hypothetical protein BKA66DRAFT_565939 [Pyrenochaeta sp. MPI-SDFR-AT-0127]|nr:hypothetical protein BKA66DRAFT_565939 [Pyrenochaeta sp. MPI-SDFR-AT-0127]